MTWAQRVRKVFAEPSEFVSPEAEKSDLLLEALEGQAEASIRAEYEPQIQKLRDELDRLRQKASPHFSVDFVPGLPIPRGESILPQAMLDDIERLRRAERAKFAMGHFVTEPEKSVAQTVLDSLCSLMTCGVDEVLGLVTEYRAAYDRYSVLAERLGVELSHANADAEVTQAFDNLRAREAAYLHILDALGVQNAGDSVIRIDRLKQQVVDVENHNIALRRQNEELLERIAELSEPPSTFGLIATRMLAEFESASAAQNGAATPIEAPSEVEKPPVETSGGSPERKSRRAKPAAVKFEGEPKVPEAGLRPDRTLKELDWVQCAQVFTKIASMADRAIGSIPEHRLPASQALEFRRIYSDEIVAYRQAPNPEKQALLVAFQNARQAEEWRPKVTK